MEVKMCEEKEKIDVTLDEIRKVVASTSNKSSFTLQDIVDILESSYPDKEIENSFLIPAYLQQLERAGLVEKSRSGVGRDQKYWWHNPFVENEV